MWNPGPLLNMYVYAVKQRIVRFNLALSLIWLFQTQIFINLICWNYNYSLSFGSRIPFTFIWEDLSNFFCASHLEVILQISHSNKKCCTYELKDLPKQVEQKRFSNNLRSKFSNSLRSIHLPLHHLLQKTSFLPLDLRFTLKKS